MDSKLSPRLQCAADFVRSGDVVADIGTDHALLPIHLIQTGKIPFAYAGDLRPGPLQTAQKYVSAYGVCDKIRLFLSDGFSDIPTDYDTAVIAGMGGETIIQILTKAVKSCNKRYILQPMTKSERLREYLYTHGFCILDETAVREQDRFYTVLLVAPGKSEYEPADLYASRALRAKRDDVTRGYLQKLLDRQWQVLTHKRGSVSADEYNAEHTFYLYLKQKFTEELI